MTLAAAAATAAAIGRPLDGATWSFAAAVLAPVMASARSWALSYAQARAKGCRCSNPPCWPPTAEGVGVGLCHPVCGRVGFLLLRQLPSMSQFAAIALVGAAVAWLAVLTLLPAAIAAFDRTAPPHRAAQAWTRSWPRDAERNTRNALDVLAILVIAAAVFCAAFLPGLRFGERHLPTDPPPLLETPDARGAMHV